jgi:hypothetical protein
MSLFQAIASSPQGFALLNYALVVLLYSKIEEPLPFFLAGSGVIMIGFFLKRLIGTFIGGPNGTI